MMYNVRFPLVFVVMLFIQACDAFDKNTKSKDDMVFDGQSSLRLYAPNELATARSVAVESLAVEVAIRYTASGNEYETLQQTDSSSAETDTFWQLDVDVPANTPFVLSITWFEQDVRLDLVRVTREFDGFSSNERVAFSYDFSPDGEFSTQSDALDYAGFDLDSDGVTNLDERKALTDPFDRADPGIDPLIGDSPSLIAEPIRFDFQVTRDTSGTELLSLRNIDVSERTFTISSNAEWLNLDPASGAIPENSAIDLSVTYTCNDEVDVLSTTLTVQSAGTETIVPITLNCIDVFSPVLSGATTDLELETIVSGEVSGFVSFGNTGNAVLNYSFTTDDNWLTASVVSGQMQPGVSAQIRIDATCADEIEVRSGTLNIASDGGNSVIDVTLNCRARPIVLVVQPLSLSLNALSNSEAMSTFSLQNIGSMALDFTATANNDWLTIAPASGLIAAGSSINVSASALCPENVTTRSTQVNVNSNSGNSTISITQNCSEPSEPVLDIVDSGLSLTAETGANVESSIQISNTGNAPLIYVVASEISWLSVAQEGGTLEASESATLVLAASCDESFIGSRSANVSIASNGGQGSVGIALLCRGARLNNVNPDSLELSAISSQSAQSAVSFANGGNIEMNFVITSDSDWLTTSIASGRVQSDSSEQVEIQATCGTSVETRTGTLNIESNGGNARINVLLNCTKPPVYLAVQPLSLNLTATRGSEAANTFSVQNTGATELDFTVSLEDDWLTATPVSGPIDAGSSVSVSVRALCTEGVTSRTTQLAVDSIAGNEIVSITQTCTERSRPVLEIAEPRSLSLTAGLAASDISSVELSNTGNAILDFNVTSDNTWLSASPTTGSIAANESTSLNVEALCDSFIGNRIGSIDITSNGGEGSVEVVLLCQGAELSNVSPTSFELSAETLQPAQGTLSFTNTGNVVMNFSVNSDSDWLCPDDAGSADCEQYENEPFSGQLSPDELYSLPIAANCPARIGSLSGSLSLSGNFETFIIPVTLECNPPPLLASDLSISYIKPKTFSFTWVDTEGADAYYLLESEDGRADYVAVSPEIPAGVQKYDHTVALYFRDKASYQLQTCSENDCVVSDAVPVQGNLVGAIGFLEGPEESAFGDAIDISSDGSTLAVMAGDVATVYIYVRSISAQGGVSYQLEDSIDLSSLQSSKVFSLYSISLNKDGTKLAIGLPEASYNRCECQPGTVLLYARNSNLTDNNVANRSTSGVAPYPESSQRIFSSMANSMGISSAPSSTGSWFMEDQFFSPDSQQGLNFGSSVAIDSTASRILVGNPGRNQVIEYSFDLQVDEFGYGLWYQSNIINAPVLDGPDGISSNFGRYLQASDSFETLIISSDVSNLNDTTDANEIHSTVYVYRGGFGWDLEKLLIASNSNPKSESCNSTYDCSDGFGISLTVSGDGDTIVVGAPLEDSNSSGVNGDESDNSLGSSGAVYVYARNGGVWDQQAYIKASNPDSIDFFGHSVDLDFTGKTLAVGAWEEASQSLGFGGDETDDIFAGIGAGYLFSVDDGQWYQSNYIKASNSTINFGEAIRISDDGQSLFISSSNSNELYYY